ncbi:hypothetical protein [Nitrosospira briensis]|nr:hypothetical protein [Nitrosospira briensis]
MNMMLGRKDHAHLLAQATSCDDVIFARYGISLAGIAVNFMGIARRHHSP